MKEQSYFIALWLITACLSTSAKAQETNKSNAPVRHLPARRLAGFLSERAILSRSGGTPSVFARWSPTPVRTLPVLVITLYPQRNQSFRVAIVRLSTIART